MKLYKAIPCIFFAILMLTTSFSAKSQSQVVGKWKTVDDETGEIKSVVEIYKNENNYEGKILRLYRKPDQEQNPKCTACEGAEKNKPVLGMTIIKNMQWNDKKQQLEDGTILDPKSGKVYDSKIWFEDDKLMVRGYIMFFYRTQSWLKYEEE